ncbi:MAG: nitric oxide reductase activation protein [Pseudomonadota bacterium]|nr:nitric oxide reductase activation protein [Pseudomonadota bacterium]MDP1903063.1 nitric oxide reductase activation protein [Pseudomonadota bacterium]MDP2353052.1 nitric oxide reductase activation protein [Pseudomonadota bacterium]
MNAAAITLLLEDLLEADFSFRKVGPTAALLATLSEDEQSFLLTWIKRIASTNLEVAWQFARRAPELIGRMDRRLMEAWAVGACDTYDRQGLRPALQVLEEADHYAERQLEMTAGVLFEDVAGVLGNFVRGLSGRPLRLEQGDSIYTDTEKIYLPGVIARFPVTADNFQLAKAAVALLWAQARFGTFHADLAVACEDFPEPRRALAQLHGLETLRLSARLARELPGLHREMERLKQQLGEGLPPGWEAIARRLAQPEAALEDSLVLLGDALRLPDFVPWCYQGELRPEAVAAAFAARRDKEKARLRVKLAELLEEKRGPRGPDQARRSPEKDPPEFAAEIDDEEGRLDMEITLDGAPIAPPDDVKALLSSVYLDFGEIPPEYLVPAGDGEYDPSLLGEQSADPDSVWQGTYHEEGALFYPEWDMGREHYRKNWCVVREKDVPQVHDGFYRETLEKHAGLVKHLRKSFEAMRDENRLLKRQVDGDEVDIDALVEALADAKDGSEMSDRLFVRQHRAERNIAVAFMVDMSGSTRGWINEAEREALVLLCEALERLGDRYAIYGFSGVTRKRCELFRIKTFAEPYGDEVKARISGIRAQEYTRMGFAIRHLSKLLNEVDAATKVLITLSDGRPDDYFDGYRGKYGIEDTRMALLEARRSGVHPFCITIDREARDYLPHMYGAARYIILDDVRQLPFKVSDIYRRLTR